MNSLQRSLVTKAGYDHGWEVALEDPAAGAVLLTSAHHPTEARITQGADGWRWMIRLPLGRLTEEISRVKGIHVLGSGQFGAGSDRELGELLSHASRLARSLPDLPCRQFEETVARELAEVSPATVATEVQRMVRQRVGQQIYRQSLMDYWGGACAVTGIAIPELLRASHAKPWAECTTDADRLNVFNGFLLAAHLDALFDRHLLTFEPTGQILLAPVISPEIQRQLGITGDLKLRWVSPAHQPFIEEHRRRFSALHQAVQI